MSNIIGEIWGGLTGGTQANATTQAANTAANAQLQALGMVQKTEAPYVQAGQQALGQYQSLLNGGAANFDVSKLPGYQFQMQQGTDAIQNSAAARGQGLSGNTLQGLQQYGQGLASTQFQQYMSQLAGLANMGQSAASGQANLGANLMSGAGASLASGIQGAGQANAQGGANLFNLGSQLFNSPAIQSGLGSAWNALTGPSAGAPGSTIF